MSILDLTDDEQRDLFRRNLTFQVMASGKSQVQIATDLKISAQRLNTWLQGKAMPRIGMVEKLALYFHVSKSKLLDPPPKEEAEELEKSEDERLLEAYHNAIPPIQRAVRAILGMEGGDPA